MDRLSLTLQTVLEIQASMMHLQSTWLRQIMPLLTHLYLISNIYRNMEDAPADCRAVQIYDVIRADGPLQQERRSVLEFRVNQLKIHIQG